MTEARIWDYLSEHDAAIRDMRNQGVPVPQIFHAIGAKRQRHIVDYCAHHGIASTYHVEAPGGQSKDWKDCARAATAKLGQAIWEHHPDRRGA